MLLSITSISSLFAGALALASFVNQTEVRDLRSYEKAGPFSLTLNLDAQSRIKLEAEVRKFVWEHWRERRLGYVTFTKFSKEGEPSTSHLFVEPDEEGVWRVAVKIDRMVVESHGSKRRHRSSTEYIAYALERIEVPTSGLNEPILLPEIVSKKPDSYRLVLKDKDGKPLSRL
jgi:hypothetical protein